MESGELQSSTPGLQRWDPNRYLRKLDPDLVRLSHGFLRTRPEKWFPGFAAQWLPLAHALGVELKIVEVQPLLSTPRNCDRGFGGTIDEEPLAIVWDQSSEQVISECIAPGSSGVAAEAILEYLSRRFLSSLALAWSGPESSVVKFDTSIDLKSIKESGAIKLGILLNNRPAHIWLSLGPQVVERLDGLWRRQIRSTSKQQIGGNVAIEIAQLAVAPSMLVDYIRPGTTIDLEVTVSDMVTLRLGNKSWLPGRLCDVDGRLGVEIISGTVPTLTLPEGSTRLSVDFGSFELDAGGMAELSQVGAVLATNVDIGASVSMVVNSDRVATAYLCTYEGRFAVTVEG